MTTAFQNNFNTFLLNLEFGKEFSNISHTLESGIQFGYSPDTMESVNFFANEYEYRIMQRGRIVCDSQCQCLELMLKDVNFACVCNTYCA